MSASGCCPRYRSRSLGRVIGALALCASFALIIVGARARMMQSSSFAANLAWLGSLNGGFFSSLAVLTVMRDLFLGPAVLLASPGEAATLESASAIVVPLLAVLATIIGFIDARRRPRVVDVKVPLPVCRLRSQGFTIAQISDVHVGPTIKRDFLRGIVETVNSLDVDLVAITGDLVDGSVEQLATHVEPLARLRARHGTYFVTGNHEYYSGATAWIAELRRLGLHVLLNEHVVLNHRGAPLLLAGVTDYSAHQFDPAQRSDPQAALAGASPDLRPRVLLAHQPRTAAAAADAGFDLQLSGHTHGGQFWPWNLFVRLQQPFTAGLDRLARPLGLHQPRQRLLGPAQAAGRALGDRPGTAGGGRAELRQSVRPGAPAARTAALHAQPRPRGRRPNQHGLPGRCPGRLRRRLRDRRWRRHPDGAPLSDRRPRRRFRGAARARVRRTHRSARAGLHDAGRSARPGHFPGARSRPGRFLHHPDALPAGEPRQLAEPRAARSAPSSPSPITRGARPSWKASHRRRCATCWPQ